MYLKNVTLLFTVILGCFILSINCHQNHHQEQHGFQQGYQQQGVNHNPNQMMDNINKDHVLEHLDGVINKPKDQMTVDEQNFYYFKLHDYDNNNMLDGLELVSAFAHNEEHKDDQQPNSNNSAGENNQNAHGGNGHNDQGHHQTNQHPRITDDELMKLIDGIMVDEDRNLDGYITYQEFLHAIKA